MRVLAGLNGTRCGIPSLVRGRQRPHVREERVARARYAFATQASLEVRSVAATKTSSDGKPIRCTDSRREGGPQ